ncbi:MAG: transporter [Ignavibacteria bacterium]|nr:transporter [Ignavibacteria bacterium]
MNTYFSKYFFYMLGLISLLSQWFSILYSQDELITDRPDQTESAFTVSAGFIQFEGGVSMETYSFSYLLPTYPEQISQGTRKNFYPSFLLRTGITNNFEMRLGWGMYKADSSPIITEPLIIGFKLKLADEKKFIPQSAFIFHLSVPLRKEHSDYISPDFRLAFSHTLTETMSIAYNFGTEWELNKSSADGKLVYTLAGAFDLGKRLSAFAEIFGYIGSSENARNLINGGLTYLILKNLQADIYFGFGLSENTPDWFTGAGISVKLPAWNVKR